MTTSHLKRAVLAVALLASVSGGCSSTSTCSRDADDSTVLDGKIVGNIYQSAQYGEQYAYFPPARTVTFDLCGHHDPAGDCTKNFQPSFPQIWLAFTPHGTLAPSAGNESLLVALERNKIAIKNDTCSEFHVLIVAQVVPEDAGAPDAGAPDAGASGAGP